MSEERCGGWGTPLVDGKRQAGNVLRTDGWAYPSRLQQGHCIAVAHGYPHALHFTVTRDCEADRGGVLCIPVMPPLQPDTIHDNAAVWITLQGNPYY